MGLEFMIHLEELVSNGWKRDLQGLEKTGSALAEQARVQLSSACTRPCNGRAPRSTLVSFVLLGLQNSLKYVMAESNAGL